MTFYLEKKGGPRIADHRLKKAQDFQHIVDNKSRNIFLKNVLISKIIHHLLFLIICQPHAWYSFMRDKPSFPQLPQQTQAALRNVTHI